MRFRIRRAAPADAEPIAALERECFSHPWSLDSVAAEFHNPVTRLFVATRLGKVVGYAGVQVAADEGYITNVAVTARYRKRGVGRRLITALTELAGQESLRFLTLELRESNLAAAALYSGCGFTQAGLRRAYYDDPTEDAVLMTLWLGARGENDQ